MAASRPKAVKSAGNNSYVAHIKGNTGIVGMPTFDKITDAEGHD